MIPWRWTLGLAWAALVSVPAADQPARTLMLMGDHAGNGPRWKASPFPELLGRPWATTLRARAAVVPGPFLLVDVLQGAPDAARMQVAVDDLGQPCARLSGVPAADLPALLAKRGTIDGDHAIIPLGPAFDQALRLPRGLPGVDRFAPQVARFAPLPASVLEAPPLPAVDCEARFAVPVASRTAAVTATWTLAPYGLHERLSVAGLPLPATAAAGIDRGVFAQLPASAVSALTLAPLSDLLAAAPWVDRAAIDADLRQSDLPALADLAPRIGASTVWIEALGPMPAVTLAIATDQPTATLLLAWLDRRHRFVPAENGVHLGAIGFMPLQAGWKQGRLVLTMHPRGLAAANADGGSMTADPEAAAAVGDLPAGPLLVAGISRSGPSWGLATALAPWLARRHPELATLATDLKAAGRHGFLAVSQDGAAKTLVLDAGGLFGGPLSTAAITSGFLNEKAVPPAGPAPQTLRDL